MNQEGCGQVMGHGIICGQGVLCHECNPDQDTKMFHHGGRLGDALYALYTIKKLGGGRVYLSLYHSPGWNQEMLDSLLPLLEYQKYIKSADQCETPPHFGNINISHDLHDAEDSFNPEDFPEWIGPTWPGNGVSILKRYALHFNIHPDFEETWLDAPQTKDVDIVFHMPQRRCLRDFDEWIRILLTLSHHYKQKVIILAGPDDAHEWGDMTKSLPVIVPQSFLETADYINSAKLFIGGASSCNVCAEGLKQWRMVEIADGCHDIYAQGRTGFTINGWSPEDVVAMALLLLKKEGKWKCSPRLNSSQSLRN